MAFYSDEEQAIRARLNTMWTALHAASPAIAFPGVEFDSAADKPYIALDIISGAASQIACGVGGQVRCPGIIQVTVCIPDGKGEKELRGYIDELCTIFDNVQFSSGASGTIRTRRSSPGPLIAKAGMLQRAISWEFWRDVPG